MTEPATDDQMGLGPCAACGHDPACGFASIFTSRDNQEKWYCHTDTHSCYVPGSA